MSIYQVSVQAQLRTHAATHARALAINGKGRVREKSLHLQVSPSQHALTSPVISSLTTPAE